MLTALWHKMQAMAIVGMSCPGLCWGCIAWACMGIVVADSQFEGIVVDRLTWIKVVTKRGERMMRGVSAEPIAAV